MAKKNKPTREFSPMAKRIYNYVLKAVNARSQGLTVLRQIDREIDKIRVGSPDPELKEQIITLEGQVSDADEIVKEHTGVVADLEEKHKTELTAANGEAAEWEKEFKNLSVEFQKVSGENDDRGLEIIKLEEKVTELEESAGSDPAEAVGAGPPYKDETPDPDADPDDSLKDEEDANVKADSGDPPSQPAK